MLRSRSSVCLFIEKDRCKVFVFGDGCILDIIITAS
jgi:hypothetical protein